MVWLVLGRGRTALLGIELGGVDPREVCGGGGRFGDKLIGAGGVEGGGVDSAEDELAEVE